MYPIFTAINIAPPNHPRQMPPVCKTTCTLQIMDLDELLKMVLDLSSSADPPVIPRRYGHNQSRPLATPWVLATLNGTTKRTFHPVGMLEPTPCVQQRNRLSW